MARVAFLGTPQVAVPALQALLTVAEVPLVVTRPDRPRGRSRRALPSPVRAAADARGIPVATPEAARELAGLLGHAGPLDACLVVAYGMLIPPAALAVPRLGHVNIHFSILPRWRGAAPVQRAILAGDERVGVSMMLLDEGLDTGPVLAVRAGRLGTDETAGDVLERLARSGSELVSELLPAHLAGEVVPIRQPDEGVTQAPRIEAEERRLRLEESPEAFSRRVRALAPRPGAYAILEEAPFRVLAARPLPGSAEPGSLHLDGSRLVCGAGGGRVELVEVQPAGRRPMRGSDWARGRRDGLGRLR